jgi:hypothetical protein
MTQSQGQSQGQNLPLGVDGTPDPIPAPNNPSAPVPGTPAEQAQRSATGQRQTANPPVQDDSASSSDDDPDKDNYGGGVGGRDPRK